MLFQISNSLILIAFGAMIFFSFIIAPVTFTTLDAQNAGKFIRRLFPFYYAFNLITLLLCLVLAFFDGSFAVRYHIVILCSVLFALTLFYLMPKINKYRDSENHKMFKIFHRTSVLINFVQLILLGTIAIGYY
jgi:ABC-type transport system involved in cytochrome bd biosynthesis fused ATPase/permease subunit